MRVYVPATSSTLARLWADRLLAATPYLAFAVTPALREWYAEGEEEELEYAAMSEAAVAALRLLAAECGDARRRLVLAADVDDAAVAVAVGAGTGRAAVSVGLPLRLESLASVLVDDPAAAADVAAAVRALSAADAGDEDARFLVDQASGHELGWYAVQEIPHLPIPPQ